MSKKEQKTFSQCPCVGETLDKLVQPAMLAILTQGSLHGYELARKVASISHFSDDAPDLSGVYRALKSLETRGMVTSSWDTPREGRPKRLFAITDEGRQCLELWETTLKHYHRAVGSLLKTVQKAVR